MQLPSLSMKTKLGFGFFLMTLLSLILGLFSICTFKQETNLVKQIFTNSYQVSIAIKNIHTEAMSVNASLYLLAMSDSSSVSRDEIEKIYTTKESIEREFTFLFKEYRGPKRDLQEAYDIYKETLNFRENFFTLLGKLEERELENIMAKSGRELMERLNEKIVILERYSDKRAQEYHSMAIENEKSAIYSLGLFLLFLSLLSIAIAIRAISSIMTPLETLLAISKSVAKGELELPNNKEIHNMQSRGDEIGELFSAYYNTLNETMSPYRYIIKSNRNLVEMTAEVGRLLASFDKYIIASKTDLSGKITYTSKAFEDISQYSKEELISKPQNIVRHPDMPSETFKELWRTIQSQNIWHGEIKNRKKGGEYYWVYAHISPDIDRDGKIIGYNAIHQDITQRKAFEELSNTLEERVETEIQKSNKKTEHMLEQSRLALMGEMISMIAHQWRQPLSSISVISGTLMLDIELDSYEESNFKKSLESINSLTQHLSSTIDDFRGFFKENKEEELVEIKSIVEESISIINYTLKSKEIALEIEYKMNPEVKTYVNEIKQVILNLLKNSEDILVEKRVESARIKVSVYEDAEYLFIDVEDNGGGVAQDAMSKVFEPYFSTKKAKEGTGLGLYMSKTIIEEHCGGELLLRNTQVGACFTIKLPTYHKESLDEEKRE